MRPFPVRVTFRNVDRSAALEAKLRRRAERLAPLAREALACGVVVEALRRGWCRRRLFRVQVELAVPGEDVIARNDVNDEAIACDPYAAAREAFDAAERRLLAGSDGRDRTPRRGRGLSGRATAPMTIMPRRRDAPPAASDWVRWEEGGDMHYESPSGAETLPDIVMVEDDVNRLRSRLACQWPILHWRAVEFLVGELDRATVVSEVEVPPATVTMHSVVEYRDERHGVTRVAQLVYPEEERLNDRGLSVLTPIGAALIGLRGGQSISFAEADGTVRSVTVVRVLYQPEEYR